VNCPNCGAINRPNARFCAQCRTSLMVGVTMKVCPRCGRASGMAATSCVHCGHTFASPAPPIITGRIALAAGGLVLILLIAVAVFMAADRERSAPISLTDAASPPGGAMATPIGTPSAGLERALRATVQIIVPLDGERRSSGGSGSVLTDKGHILTNLHVVGDPKTGWLYNARGTIYVAISPADLKGPPQVRYMAEVVKSDQRLDLALLKIRATREGKALPADLGLTTLPVGDSDRLAIGDEISIIGFPGLGGDTVTYTKGSVSGFLSAEGWIKTDAEINAGNSGGAAINQAGQLVGIPSAAATETTRVPGKIGLVRPVNLAKPLIEWAMQDARK
jgi:S1-C subfamily serine protease/ribosomal protein L40E